MAKWGSCEFDQLIQLRENLQKLQDTDMVKFCDDVSRELAARLLALVIPRTPVGKRPKLSGARTMKVKGVSGKSRSFLTEEGARHERYWNGYVGGTLRRGWIAKTQSEAESGKGSPTASQAAAYANSLPVSKSGHIYRIEIINPVNYASYVEFGHRQTPGRYVPALGKSLKAGWVQGQYFLTISEQELRQMAPNIIERKLNQLLTEVFNV